MNMPLDLLKIIAKFLVSKKYKLLDWIDENKLDIGNLSRNPFAISIIEKNIEKINWTNLSSNCGAIDLLKKNIDKINWIWLGINTNAIDIILSNIDKIDWGFLSRLEQNLDKLD